MSTILPYHAEYAKALRTFCKSCRKLTPRDTLQIGIIQQCMTEDSMKPEWYDMDCFFKIRRPLSEDFIDGFANLRYSHQMQILGNIEADANDSSTNSPTKKNKSTSTELEQKIERQNNDLFTIFDKLQEFKDRDDFPFILKENKQYVPEQPAQIFSHLCDVIYFGALAPCSVCKDGQFVFKNSTYHCTGFDSPWSSCINTVKEAKRIPVKIPKKYQGTLGTNFKVHKRILRNVTEFNPDDFEAFTKQPLFGIEFMIVGASEKLHDEIKNKILKMGGKVVAKIHTRLAAVISDEYTVNVGNPMIKEAHIHRIQVIPYDFLNEIMEADPVEVIVKRDLSKWGKGPYERLPELKTKKSNVRPATGYMNMEVADSKNAGWEAVLDFVDISTNKNTFISLQLQGVSHGNTSYVLKGRIGTSIGTTNRKHYTSLEQAQTEFKRIYLEKTGNEYGTTNFVKKPGLFNHVNIDNETLTLINRNQVPTKLQKPIFDLMELLYRNDEVFKSTLIAFCFNMDIMPLGKLTKTQIQTAMNLVADISTLQYSIDVNQIIAASNQMYWFPQFSFRRPPIINTCAMIQEKLNILQVLLEKQLRYEFLISPSNLEKNILDVCYAQLEESAEFSVLNKASKMYTEICKYIQNMQLLDRQQLPHFYPGSCEVDEIFVVERHEELERYAPYDENFNRKLLFHGSRIENFVITPLEAKTGAAFGKGIYFSDSATKSAAYCGSQNGLGLVLLCEVAAGISDVSYTYDNKSLIDHWESVQALGRYYPHPLLIRPDGLKIPNGTLIRREEETGLLFNEFVVFDATRVKIRYLVKLKFNKINKQSPTA